MATRHAASISAGRRSRRSSWTRPRGARVRPAPDADDRRPADVALAMIGAVREAAGEAGVGVSELAAVGVGSPGAVDDEAGTVTSAATCPTGRARTSWPTSSSRRSARPSRSPTTSTSPPRPSSSSARASRTAPCWACSGARAWVAGSCSTASCGRVAGRPARSATWSSRATGASAPAGASAAWRPTRAAARWRPGRARRPTRARRPSSSRSWRRRASRGLSSGIWERALERDDKLAHHLVDRAVDAIGVGRRVVAQPARRRGGRDRRRARPAARRALRGEDPRRRDAAPLRRPPPARDPARLARRPGGAIGATLLAAGKAPRTPSRPRPAPGRGTAGSSPAATACGPARRSRAG